MVDDTFVLETKRHRYSDFKQETGTQVERINVVAPDYSIVDRPPRVGSYASIRGELGFASKELFVFADDIEIH